MTHPLTEQRAFRDMNDAMGDLFRAFGLLLVTGLSTYLHLYLDKLWKALR